MNLFLRIFFVWVSHFFRSRLGFLEPSVLKLAVLPNDLDVYGHMNNGRYLTIMDLGRMDLILRTGLSKTAQCHHWNPIVAAINIQYRRSFKLFQIFELHTRILGWDEKWVYLEQCFLKDGLVCVRALVRGLFVGKESVPTGQVLSALGISMTSPPLPPEIEQWSTSLKKSSQTS